MRSEQKSGLERTQQHVRLLLIGLVAATLTIGGVGFYVGTQYIGTTDQATWFTALGTGVAILALLAAIAATYFALPGFIEVRRQQQARPRLRLEFQLPDEGGRWYDVKNDAITRVPTPFRARVVVFNEGDAVLRWGILNIQVPTPCTIEAIKSWDGSSFHSSHTAFPSSDLYDDRTVECNAAIGERDFPPVHNFIFNVNVTLPPGHDEWPLFALLEGYPYACGRTRMRVWA